jgi:hypothetical protein
MPAQSFAVKLACTLYDAFERAERAYRLEREHLEDLFAEARAQYESDRARPARPGRAPSPTAAQEGSEPATNRAA